MMARRGLEAVRDDYRAESGHLGMAPNHVSDICGCEEGYDVGAEHPERDERSADVSGVQRPIVQRSSRIVWESNAEVVV